MLNISRITMSALIWETLNGPFPLNPRYSLSVSLSGTGRVSAGKELPFSGTDPALTIFCPGTVRHKENIKSSTIVFLIIYPP
jgi:hypothetical protein